MYTPQNNKIEKMLQSLEGTAKAAAPDFLYTRLKARMEKELLTESPVFFLLQPAFLTACLAIVFAFNIVTLINSKKHSSHNGNGEANIESFAKEYNLNSNQLYE